MISQSYNLPWLDIESRPQIWSKSKTPYVSFIYCYTAAWCLVEKNVLLTVQIAVTYTIMESEFLHTMLSNEVALVKIVKIVKIMTTLGSKYYNKIKTTVGVMGYSHTPYLQPTTFIWSSQVTHVSQPFIGQLYFSYKKIN